MRYVQGNDIYLNIFRMLIGRSVPEADVTSCIFQFSSPHSGVSPNALAIKSTKLRTLKGIRIALG